MISLNLILIIFDSFEGGLSGQSTLLSAGSMKDTNLKKKKEIHWLYVHVCEPYSFWQDFQTAMLDVQKPGPQTGLGAVWIA